MTVVDEFTTIEATADTDFRRDQWGRPLIKQADGKRKGYTRCSSAAKTIEDTYNLEKWARRNAIYGMAYDASLVARMLAIGGDPSTWGKPDKAAVNGIVEAAEAVAKAHKAADIGTAVHRLTERLDRGEDVKGGPYQADLDAYRQALDAAGLAVDPQWIECRIVNDELQMAGTADRIVKVVEHHSRTDRVIIRYRIADLKTSATVDYGGLGWAAQLAAYAGGHLYDCVAEERLDTPDMDRDVGLIIHLPAGQGTCTIYEVDIAAGLGAARLANDIRRIRKSSKQWIVPHVKATANPDPADRLGPLRQRYREMSDLDKQSFLDMKVDSTDLDAIERALDDIFAFRHIEPPTPQPPPPRPAVVPPVQPPDEGGPVGCTFAALEQAYATLDAHAIAWLKTLIVEGNDAGLDWRAQHHHTLRRYELYRGLITLAGSPYFGDGVDKILEALVWAVAGDTVLFANVAPGAAIGSLDAFEAAVFAAHVDDLIAGRRTTVVDETTKTLRLTAA